MATRINPLAGKYFNDPNFASAFGNLASVFAPPDPTEMLAYEQLNGERAANERLATMWTAAGDDFDRMGIAANLYDPSNSYYAVDTAATTSRSNNAADNDRALQQTILGGVFDRANSPLGYGEALPGIPDDVAAALGMPALPSTTGAALGAPMPLMSETEMKAHLLGGMSPEEQRAIMGAGVETVQTVDPATGGPIFSTELDALGKPAYVNKGATAAADALILVDTETGKQHAGVFKDGGYYLADGSTPAPANLVPQELPRATGSSADIGGTTSSQTRYLNTKAAANTVNLMVQDLRELINSQAGAAGLAGGLMSLSQNMQQTVRELSAAAEQSGIDAPVTAEFLSQLQAKTGSGFNPVYQRINSALFSLAMAKAQMANPGGEVGQIALLRELESLGSGGMFTNDQSILAALDSVERDAQIRLAAAETLLGRPVPATGPVTAQNPPTARPRAVNHQTGETVEFDGTNWVPVQ